MTDVDHNTQATATVSIDNNKELLAQLLENYKSVVGDEECERSPQLWYSDDIKSLRTDEYYFNEDEVSINYSGQAETPNGNIYVGVNIPLSDVVLMSILKHASNKFNRLREAMELLK